MAESDHQFILQRLVDLGEITLDIGNTLKEMSACIAVINHVTETQGQMISMLGRRVSELEARGAQEHTP